MTCISPICQRRSTGRQDLVLDPGGPLLVIGVDEADAKRTVAGEIVPEALGNRTEDHPLLLEAIEDASADPGRSWLVFLDEFNRCQEAARNVLMPLSEGRGNLLALTRWCVVGIAVLSAAIAVSDVGAFELLQGTYAIGIPAFVLLTFALYQKQTRHLAGVVTLALSVGLWLFEITAGLVADGTSGEVFTPAFPAVLLVFSLGVYIITDRLAKVFDLGRSSPSNIDSVP